MAAWMLLVLASLWIPAAAADEDVSCLVSTSCVLPCSFKSGRDPIVQWRKDPSNIIVHRFQRGQDQLIDQDPDYRGRTFLFRDEISRGNASLLLSGLRLTDQGRYQCFTGTVDSVSTSFINLRVEGAVGPVSIKQSGDVLLCSSENIYFKPSVSWSRSPPSQSLPTLSVQESKEQVYSVSSTVPLPPSPPLEYTCNISTEHGWRSATYSWRPPVVDSGNVFVSCTASITSIKNLRWTFNFDQTILTQNETGLVYTAPWSQFVVSVSVSGDLTLHKLTTKQHGVYLCEQHTDTETYFTKTEVEEHPGLSPAVKGVIVFSVFLIIILVVVIVGIYCRRKHKRLFNSHLSRLYEHLPWLPAKGRIWSCQYKLKSKLETRFKFLPEGITESESLFNERYTEMFVTVVNTGQMKTCEDIFKGQTKKGTPIRTVLTEVNTGQEKTCEDNFKGQTEKGTPIRTVLTKGVAGIGKTVLTQKFSLDWAEGRANQDIQLLFPFTFRELNVLGDRRFSLVGLLQHFFSESKGLSSFQHLQVVFVFDGLDECSFPLDFTQTLDLTDPKEIVSVDVLLVNLIRGNLLPSARLWITTRPAAANQIPAECVSMVTEVRGFTDPQKQLYFQKRFTYEKRATAVISSQIVHMLCHIPVFCWIYATVIENMKGEKLPQTLTELYILFLVVQARVKNVKNDEHSETDPLRTPDTRKMVESLGKLAFEQLQEGKLIFYESDLRQCGLEPTEASVYSRVFTQVFREQTVLEKKVYWFTHLSVQEFLAALHVHQSFVNNGVNLLSEQVENSPPHTVKPFHQTAVDQALQSPNGHLDLFLRFLLGLSVLTKQNLLQDLLTQTGSTTQEPNQETVKYIKIKLSKGMSAERSMNLVHCLNELNDRHLVEEIQRYTREERIFDGSISPDYWSALVFIVLSLDTELDMGNYWISASR